MPSPHKIPKLCRHKASGRAYVTDPADKKEKWMGAYGSAEATQNYHAWVKEFLARGAPTELPGLGGSVNQLLAAYLRHAESYYRKRGKPTSEVRQTRTLVKLLKKHHGKRPADSFGSAQFRAIRDDMIASKMARSSINAYCRRIVRIWRWGVEREMVQPDTLAKLAAVKPLAYARSNARETDDVPPVPAQVVEATLPHLNKMLGDVVRLQQATGMRPGEALTVRPADVDQSALPWKVTVTDDWNKTAHKGRSRIVYLGPAARAILGPWIAACKRPVDWCFPGRRGLAFSRGRYCDVIVAACKKHDIPHWTPNRLRHSRLTEVRAVYGLDAAQAIGGHADSRTTEIYAERDTALAKRVAEESG